MLNAFQNFIKKNELFTAADKILLTVSGGVDSVVMCELFHQAGFNFGMAHCNFKLRGSESDGDAAFVKELAKKYKVAFYSVEFDTDKIAKDRGISTQMAARDLRYEWFDKIRVENNYQKIATAHHRDDQLETLFINLIRGTGIAGLHGINAKQGNLIRPLLFATRKEIVNFCKNSKLSYREDSSNASDKYLRNNIRHNLVPVLEEIDPEYLKIFEANMKRFSESEAIYAQQIAKIRDEITQKRGQDLLISIEGLKKVKPISTYLFELIREFGFSFSTGEDIIKSLDNDSGKQFYSETHRLLKDRERLIVRKIDVNAEQKQIQIQENQDRLDQPIKLKFKKFKKEADFKYPTTSEIASFDIEKLKFPLTLRKWNEGDFFHPLGSNFRKKLSDFFIDKKLSQYEKEDTWLLCSGSEIVWIVDHQIDNRFKITSKTKTVFQVEFLK